MLLRFGREIDVVLNPVSLTVRVVGDAVEIVVDEKTIPVDRVARAFPKTHPHSHISFLDKLGHEIGLLEKLDGLEQESRSVLEEHLKKIYFVPEIEEILSVKTTGTTSRWTVVTEEGERSFQVLGRESIDGDKAPAMQITDAEGKRYRITDYWEMDKDSRQVIQELLPDKIVKSKIAGRRSGSSVVMRMR